MNIKLLGVLLLLQYGHGAFAAGFTPYEWEKNRSRYVLTEKEQALTEYILKQHAQYDYVWEDKKLVMYMTNHQITRVTNAESIQRYNRLYISMHNVIELVDLKARAINKEGKVVNFDRTNLKEIKDEETGAAYRIFAIEGVESDSELEYYYTLKLTSRLFETLYRQFETPVKQSTLFLTSPVQLKFDFRVYNDTSMVRSDTLNSRNRYSLSMVNIPGLKKEGFSQFNANRKRIEFKLAYNTATSKARLNTWADAGRTFYKLISASDNDTEKTIEKYSKSLSDNPSAALADRIRNVEDQVKRSIAVNPDASDPALGEIPSILKFKKASGEGITRLLVLVFGKLNIPVQLVITCSREDARFDGSFDTWAFLDDYLLYFPGTKGFIAPDMAQLRYPLVPAKFMAQKGLFIEPVTVGEVKSGIASIKEIPALPYLYNTDNLDISVAFTEDRTANTIQLRRRFSGYNAAYMTQYYDLMTDKQKSELIEGIVKETVPDPKIGTWKASVSKEQEMTYFTVDVTFTTEHFLEKAGPKLLFKAGELIGPQVEMYRDDERQTEVENTYNRGYERLITVNIPPGYAVKNADGLRMNVQYTDGDPVPFSFVSEYAVQGSKLSITVKEYYKNIFAPLSRYEDFRKVVNAAADFNKVTLVLEKN